MKKYKIGYTSGVFDLFHIGHLNILERAKQSCEYLIVGVTTDELVMERKGKYPVIPYEERIKIIKAICFVDQVVPQFNMNKMGAWQKYCFDAIFAGDDWKGTESWNQYEREFAEVGVDIVYFPYTKHTSSTILTEFIKKYTEEFNYASL